MTEESWCDPPHEFLAEPQVFLKSLAAPADRVPRWGDRTDRRKEENRCTTHNPRPVPLLVGALTGVAAVASATVAGMVTGMLGHAARRPADRRRRHDPADAAVGRARTLPGQLGHRGAATRS